MKKILLFASALAGLFLAGSCQRENLEPMESANTVTYTVTVPDALATKGIGDDVSNVNTLHYEVYRTANAETVDFTGADRLLYHKHATAQTDGTFKIDLELVNDQNFTVLFWAQVGETNEAYDVDDLTAVTIKTPIKANQVNYAAFSGRDFIKATEKLASKTVQLTRPVAQINLGTTKASLEAFDTDINVNKSSMTVAGLSNTFYVAKQAASDAFTSTTVYNEQNVLADSLEVNGTKYVNAGMNYVGFASTVGTPVTVSYDINTTEGHIQNTIENVPVKPNFRTNIIGNLITSKTDYTIELLNTWYTPEEVVEVFAVDTAEELQEALESIQSGAEGNIVLEGDIDLGALTKAALLSTKAGENPYGLLIPAGKTIILDLNGCTLKQEVECKASYSMIKNQGNLTITGNGTISFKDLSTGGGSTWGSYIIDNTGFLTVENGTIVHLGSTNFPIENRPTNLPIQNYAGKVVINGGIISSPSFRSLRDFTAGGEIIINGGQFLGQVWMQGLGAGSSSLTINGGEFNPTAGYDGSSVYITNNGTNDVQVSITGGTFNTKIGCADSNKSGVKGCITGGLFKADPSAFVADDYVAVYDENAKVWNIAEAYAKVGETKYTSLNDAVTEALKLENASIVVLRDTEMDAVTVPNGKTITIDLNGKTITGVDTATGSYGLITNKANLTVKGPGAMKLTATNNRGWNAYSSVISNTVGGNLTVKGGAVIEHLGGTDMAYGIDNLTNGKGTSAVTTIKDATVISTYRAVRQFLNGIEATNELYVEEGAVITGANKSIWMQDPSAKLNTGKLVVEEGAELNGDVYLFVTAGSEAWPVEVSIADSALAGESTVMTGNVPAGYTVENVDGTWKVLQWTNVSTADELVAALAAEQNVIFMNDITVAATKGGYEKAGILQNKGQAINGNGFTLTVTGAGATWSCAIYTNGGLIKNLTVAGAMRGIFTAGQSSDLHIDNVEFKNVIYTFNSDGKMPAKPFGVYISNSTVNGWTSHSDMHSEVVYTNCSFGEGSGYKFCRPYGKTSFVNCTFCAGYTIDQSKTKDITFDNCTFKE